MLREINHRASV